MDLTASAHFRPAKPSSSGRFLGVGVLSQPPSENPNSSTGIHAGDSEFNEDDVVFLTGDYADYNRPSTPPSSSSPSTPRNDNHFHHHHHNHNHKGFDLPDNFGILAALPEKETHGNSRNVSHFYHKASISSSSSSSFSSRLIPSIPKPPQDRLHLHSSASSLKYHQSAPVNVPVLSQAMMKMRRRHREFDEDVDDEDDEGDGEMLPPHEIVARSSAQSPVLACSVLEGVGRTLKGRDLRQVRNAVWRQTGFKPSHLSGLQLCLHWMLQYINFFFPSLDRTTRANLLTLLYLRE